MRFRPEQHVRRQRDFRSLRENGRRLECGGFVFWYYKRPQPDASPASAPEATLDVVRVGVVASYAAVGKAVDRVRAKRRMREIFRLNQTRIPPGHDIMLVARRSINQLTFDVVRDKFCQACEKAFPTTKP